MQTCDIEAVVQMAAHVALGRHLPDLPSALIRNDVLRWDGALRALQRRVRRLIRIRRPFWRATRTMLPVRGWRVAPTQPMCAWRWVRVALTRRCIWGVYDFLLLRMYLPVQYAYLARLTIEARARAAPAVAP